jgi:hypothetical protein
MKRRNPEYSRQLLLRIGLGGSLYLLLAVILLVSSQPVGAGLFGVVLVLYSFDVVYGDRRLAILSGRPLKPPWSGSNTGSAQVLAEVPLSAGAQVALCAVTLVGERRPALVSDWEAVSWIGYFWTNIPSLQEYQVDVFVSEGPNGGTLFTCSARPRRVMSLGGITQSQKLVARLVEEIERITSQGDR